MPSWIGCDASALLFNTLKQRGGEAFALVIAHSVEDCECVQVCTEPFTMTLCGLVLCIFTWSVLRYDLYCYEIASYPCWQLQRSRGGEKWAQLL